MPGVSLLKLAFLFAVGAIGRLDIGFTEGSIPGAVAISAKQVVVTSPRAPSSKLRSMLPQ